MIKSYRDLEVWKKAVALVDEVYRVTQHFPDQEKFGLSAQLRRCAVSIPSNVAEGKTRQHKKEYVQFLFIAKGSCAELETQLIVAKNLTYIKDDEYVRFLEKIDHICRMLQSLINKLQ